MALSKPLSQDSGSTSTWFAWAEEACVAVSIQAVRGLGEHLQVGLQKSTEHMAVTAMVELSDDLIDFSLSIGRCIASPLIDLGKNAGLDGDAEGQDILMLSSSKSPGCSSISASRQVDLLGKDGAVLSLIIAGVLSPGPSGFLVLASVGPTLSLKAASAFVGTAMLWRCWLIYTRNDEGASVQTRRGKDLAIAVTGICGMVNLGLAFGGLPALLNLTGSSLSLSHYVVHQDIFLHYLADVVLCPLLLLNLGHRLQVRKYAAPGQSGIDITALLMPSIAASALGAFCMVGTSLPMSPVLIYSCLGANVCCIAFQNFNLQALQLESHDPGRKISDAYVFSQMLYTVPTLVTVAYPPARAVLAFVPLIDLLGKMGVLQLTQNDIDRERPLRV